MNLKEEIKKLERKLFRLKNTVPYDQRQPLHCRLCKFDGGASKTNPLIHKCKYSKQWVDTSVAQCPAKDKFQEYKVSCAKCKAEVGTVLGDKDPLTDKIDLVHYFFIDNPHHKIPGNGCPSESYDKKLKKKILTWECFCGNDNRTDLKRNKFIYTKVMGIKERKK